MPHGVEVKVASAPAQTALKILAWCDRHDLNTKDAIDLRIIFEALSRDPFTDEVWDDEEALAATEADILVAPAFHYARLAAEPFEADAGQAVLNVLHDPGQRRLLQRQMRSPMAKEFLDAYSAGFVRGLQNGG